MPLRGTYPHQTLTRAGLVQAMTDREQAVQFSIAKQIPNFSSNTENPYT